MGDEIGADRLRAKASAFPPDHASNHIATYAQLHKGAWPRRTVPAMDYIASSETHVPLTWLEVDRVRR